jgi:hypothetical protein
VQGPPFSEVFERLVYLHKKPCKLHTVAYTIWKKYRV